jgi:pimeloyl-ACP methyl ester carboxylesterase
VLIHPFMLSHHCWRPLVERLGPGHDVLRVSMPGHYGGPRLGWRGTFAAMVDHLESEMDRVGMETAHVVGNSLGGWAGFELARRGRARTVTAIAPAGGYESLGVRDAAMVASFLLAVVGRRGARFTNLLPTLPVHGLALRAVAHDPRSIPPADARHVVRTALGATHPLQVLLACARSIPAVGLEAVDVPVHLVFAERDVVIPPSKYAPYFVERIRHAKVTMLAGVGHCPQVEAPHTVAELLREFIAENQPFAHARTS